MPAPATLRRASRMYAFIAIAGGLVAAFLIFSLLSGGVTSEALRFYLRISAQLLLAIVSMYAVAWYLAGWLADVTHAHPALALFLAPVLSLVILALGTAFGSSYSVLVGEGSAYDFIVKPVGAIAIWGSIPTIILGIFWGIKLREAIKRERKIA